MLRPVCYWRKSNFFNDSLVPVETIVLLSNPILSWGVVAAIPSAGWRGIAHRDLPRVFIVSGYLAYLLMWVPIGRYKFLYHYMPAFYLGLLALAAELADCWEGRSRTWEEAVLLASLVPPLILAIGAVGGVSIVISLTAAYWMLARRGRNHYYSGRFVCAGFLTATAVAFFFFLPVWIGFPISSHAYQERLWLTGPGIANWK